MCIEFAFKKGGLSIIRNFLQSTAGLQNALPLAMRNRNRISFKLKTYRDGKIIDTQIVESIEEAFPAKVQSSTIEGRQEMIDSKPMDYNTNQLEAAAARPLSNESIG